jgi:hypothetical protein
MATNCRIKFHGIRAFHPAPSRKNIATGGNTACIEISDESSQIFINAGFGINLATPNWITNQRTKKDSYKCAILFSDFFWDSILGLPFFTPIHFKSSHLDVLSCATEDQAREALDDMSSNLLTPFNGISSFPAKISFHSLTTTHKWGAWTISALPLTHPLAPYPLAAWRLLHPSGIDIGIVMISMPDSESITNLAHFLHGTKTLICAASSGPKNDAWSRHRTTFDDALKIGLLTGAHDLYFTQFHPLMTDILLQSELRRLHQILGRLNHDNATPKLHLATEVEGIISVNSSRRSKAG